MNEASEFKATALCVVCESYDDSRTFPQLVGAKAQMEEIAGLLEGLGFDVRLVGGGNPDRAAFDREVEEWSEGWRRSGGRKPALILWSGHGVLADDELRLVLSDLKPGDHVGTRKVRIRRQGVSTEELIGYAVSSEADQILVVVDTCYAGDGVGDGVRTALKHWSEISLPPGRTKWLGSMASCQRNEPSDGDGPLLRALAAVLREGPRADEYLSAWSAHNELVSGVDLLAALPTRWEAEGQRPARAAVGDERPAFPNPLARPGTAPALVEHLVLAARGVGHREEGWFFSGRRQVLGKITAWMEAAAPGLFLVTGPAGCGKSAVLGRVATLADPEQRQEAERQGALREGDPDPGVRDARTFAAVHLRGLDATQAAAELAARLGLPEPRNADALRAELRELPTPPVLVLDGLDEVPAEHTQGVIEELVFPLSRMLPVLVGSRERPFRGRLKEGETLPDALVRHIGDSVTTVDLEAEPDTRQDIAEYVRRRCVAAEVDGAGVAEALADRATAQDGGFLFARLVTGFLVARLRELGGLRDTEDLLAGLPDSVEAAFEEDLRSGPRLKRDDGTELPSAARDLLTALAWAAGRGMPAGGVWEAVASALGGQGVVYDEGDVDWVLSAYGRYIVEDGAGTQAVYRLYHREFVSHLRRREGPERTAAEVVVLRAVVDLLKRQAEAGGWERVDPYVRTWLPRHAAWASVPGPGIDVLRDLVLWDRENALPHLAEALLEVSAALSGNARHTAAVEFAREATDINRDLADRDTNYLPDLAMALNNLANRLAETGDRQGALEPAHEAVHIRRQLAHTNPAAYLPNLAMALNNLAIRLAETGDRQGALEPAHEAVRHYTQLAHTNPAAYLPNLAGALNNLANHLAETGDRQGALEPAHEAVRHYTQLAHTNPAAYLPDLATSLNNLAATLAEIGDRQGALEPAHEAVRHYTQLAHTNPAAYLPELAGALNNLAATLAETGDRQGALEPAHQALHIRRQLAHTNPAAYLPDLAGSLNNLANRLAETGDRQGALEPAHEAVRHYTQLAHTNPAAYLPDLAMALNNLANRLAATGDRQGALEPAHEAVRIRRQLAHTNPAAYLPDLATSLNNLANHLAATGDRQGALEPAHEAVRIRRQLAHTNPAAYLPNLAGSLNNLANHLAATGDRQGALEPAHQAVRHYTQLAHTNPAAYLPDLATSLNNLANHLAATGDRQGALEPAHQAVRHYTQLAHANPAAYLPDLATSLNNLAAHLAETGDRQGALEPAHEAVRIRRQLAHTNPAAYLPDLATSLNNLANRLAETGDRQGALEPAHEAVRIRRQLAHTNPAAYLPNLATSLNNLANHLAETGDEPAAIQAYTDTAAGLAQAHPAATRAIEYERAAFQLGRPEPTRASGLLELIRIVNDESADQPGEIVLRARQTLRAHALTSRDSHESLKQTWRQETDTAVPDWLSLSEDTLSLVVEWVNTPTWTDSRTFWSRHADALGADEASTALAEFALAWPVAEQHQRIRELVLSEGMNAVFPALILRDTLSGWLACENWDDSKRFLQEHSELLLDESAENTLTENDDVTPGIAVHAALLRIARAEDIDTAFQCVQNRDALQRHVLRALNDGDAQALAYVAAVEGLVFDDELSSATHHQAALLLAGDPESLDLDALAEAASEADPETRNRLTSELAALATRSPDPQHTAHWFRLVQALTQTRP
ncbi:tetratricopeptide repeat protein [Streptomyces violaceus]|uniref:tetratricopeptide repeat protein n=1 Tax=Streptomyces violaceus TaxID=1936 RepID=UPI002E206ED6